MGRGPSTFKQSDLTRALKATKAAGVTPARIKIGTNGAIEIETETSQPSEIGVTTREESDQWDAALK